MSYVLVVLQFPYIDSVISETLRLFPPVPTTNREAKSGTMIGPHKVPKGTTCVTSIWSYHHDPEIWPEPLSFKPERFLPVTFNANFCISLSQGILRILSSR